MITGRALCCLLLVLLAAPAAFAGGGADKKPVSADGVVEFKYPEWVYYDLIYLAEDLGYFKDAKVRPRYVGQIAAGQMIPALPTGGHSFRRGCQNFRGGQQVHPAGPPHEVLRPRRFAHQIHQGLWGQNPG